MAEGQKMNQRMKEWDEILQNEQFFTQASAYLRDTADTDVCMLSVEMAYFDLYERINGGEKSEQLLRLFASVLTGYTQAHGGAAGCTGAHSFGVICPYEKESLEQLYRSLKTELFHATNTVGYHPAIGLYRIGASERDAQRAYECAALALSHAFGNGVTHFCEYVPEMNDDQEQIARQLTEIREGMIADEFTFFVQPQCDISKTKIVGGEALVRWIKTDGTVISPGRFIPVLEKTGFVADLDMIVWRKVCAWLRACLDKGYEPVPISINVSRIDVFSVDVPEYLHSLIEQYELEPSYLKVEITESAYIENDDKIIQVVRQLQSMGFLVMMDDFGSGYSSLNMLSSMPVDVIKLDMQFLEMDEKEEEKGVSIIESVVNMAHQMKIPIVAEGVERRRHEAMLQRMGCRYMQGYYYYKPMNQTAFEELIADGHNVDHNGFWCRQSQPLHIREFLDRNVFSDAILNQILGAVAFYDLYENNIEITRVNEQYLTLAKVDAEHSSDYHKRFWNHVRDDDRQLLFAVFHQAYDNMNEGASEILNFVCGNGEVKRVRINVFFMREKEGHKYFCATLVDMTGTKKKRTHADLPAEMAKEFTPDKQKLLAEAYDSLICGYGIGKLNLDGAGTPCGFEIVYVNEELRRICGGDQRRLHFMIEKLFSGRMEQLFEKAYGVAYQGAKAEFHVYSNISARYLDLHMHQYENGYVACMVTDVTHSKIYQKSMDVIMASFREVYFLHLQDNYCRMIYPDENHLLDSGNYEELVNRHFCTGKITSRDEAGVRAFLSLEHLKKELATRDSVECTYQRALPLTDEEWCLTTVQVSEREQGEPKTAIITIRSVEAVMREKTDIRFQEKTKLLTSMSEGFFVYRADVKEEILYANPTTLRLFGCQTMDEFQEQVHNSFSGMVYEEDLARVKWGINEQIRYSERKMDYIVYRIRAKDGSVRWIEDVGHLEDTGMGDGSKLFYVFITDVTDVIPDDYIQKLEKKNQRFNGQSGT